MSCVIGIPDSYKIQAVKAFIMLKPGVPANEQTEQEIMDYCRKHIAKYAMPYEIEFCDSLPKTLVGKVAYRVLEQQELAKAVLLQEIDLLAEGFRGNGKFFIVFIAENVVAAVIVGVVQFPFFDIGSVDLIYVEDSHIEGVLVGERRADAVYDALADTVVLILDRAVYLSVLGVEVDAAEVTGDAVYGSDDISVHIRFDKAGGEGYIDIFMLAVKCYALNVASRAEATMDVAGKIVYVYHNNTS
jgi:hypothetical protein